MQYARDISNSRINKITFKVVYENVTLYRIKYAKS